MVFHFGKIRVEFENGIVLDIIADGYPYRVKENKETKEKLKKNYDDNLKVEISCEPFFSSLKENYKVKKITGIDIPLRGKKKGKDIEWVLDEKNSISIVLYPSDKKEEGIRIFDRSAIRMTENATYDVIVYKNGEESPEDLRISLSHREISSNFITPFGSDRNKCHMNFQGYTFFGNILILNEKDEIVARLPVLVFPTKLSPDEAEEILNELLEKMEEVTAISPTHLFIEPRGTIEKTPIQTLILINNMFSEKRRERVPLGKTLRAISLSPDKKVVKERVKKQPDEVTLVDEEAILDAVIGGDIKRAGHHCHFRVGKNSYSFTGLMDEVTRISYDTPPNRFIKYFLEFLSNTINTCVEKALKEEDAKVKEGFVENLIKEVQNQRRRFIVPFLNLDWMKEVSRITHLPPPSQKLLKDPFYSSAFFDYIDLISNLKVMDEEMEKYLQNPITWMPKLYERWCHLKLKEITDQREITDQKVKYQPKFPAEKSKQGWFSYSLPLRPDFKIDGGKLILLDAKYRVDIHDQFKELDEEERKAEKRGEFKKGDLYKMHTYREAIVKGSGEKRERPLWIIALYPGDNFVLFPEEGKKVEEEVDKIKKEEIMGVKNKGGVGAIPFRPKYIENEEYRKMVGKFLKFEKNNIEGEREKEHIQH